MKRLLAALLASCVFASLAPAAAEAPRTAYRAAKLLDVDSGRYVHDPVIVVEGGRIVRVGSGLAVPDGTPLIDFGDAILLPGLIDAHVHLGGGPDAATRSQTRNVLHAARAAQHSLYAGFTTLRSMGGPAYSVIALRDAINDGDIVGPRILDAGALVAVTGGHCSGPRVYRPEIASTAEGVADGPDELRRTTRKLIKYGADFIKACITGGFVSGTDPNQVQFAEDEVRAVIDTAHGLGRKVAIHAHGADGIRLAARLGADSIEHGTLIDDEGIAAVKKGSVFIVPTVKVMASSVEKAKKAGASEGTLAALAAARDAQRRNLAKAYARGVVFAFGTDFTQDGSNATEFSALLELGLTPLQAIQTATVHAAQLLGLSERIGKVAPGYFADFIAVQDDPLRNVRALEKVVVVVKNGELVRNDLAPTPLLRRAALAATGESADREDHGHSHDHAH